MTKSDTEKYHVAELEKAISMIRLDLDHSTAGEKAKLATDLYEFVGGSEIAGIKLGQAVPVDKLKPEEFLEFERVPAHYIPEIIADLKKTLVGIADQPASFFFHAKITDGKLTAFADPASPFKLSWIMNPLEGARFALSLHLAGSGLTGNRIRLCPLKTCRNVFLLTRYARADRLHYCSNRCARNAATLRYREKQSKQTREKTRKKTEEKMNANEKGVAGTTPQRETDKSILAQPADSVERIPDAPKLNTRLWKAPRNINSSIYRVKTKLSAWVRMTNETAFLVGKEFIWMKNTRKHGDFMDAVAQTGVHIRTARRLMEHARECDEVNRLLDYHPNKKKRDTVSLLEPPADQDDLEEEKPKHEAGVSKEWNATDGGRSVFARYDRVVSGRTEEERRDVRTAFNEMADDADDDFAESRRIIREGGGRIIEHEDE